MTSTRVGERCAEAALLSPARVCTRLPTATAAPPSPPRTYFWPPLPVQHPTLVFAPRDEGAKCHRRCRDTLLPPCKASRLRVRPKRASTRPPSTPRGSSARPSFGSFCWSASLCLRAPWAWRSGRSPTPLFTSARQRARLWHDLGIQSTFRSGLCQQCRAPSRCGAHRASGSPEPTRRARPSWLPANGLCVCVSWPGGGGAPRKSTRETSVFFYYYSFYSKKS
ncbi:hypothetical protein psal_cds_242 [Pandoravirus salinus]|uniref:Uncharacterized protein n=1 Tax=Pandoravirus salinus TaxID=1349410 RepID=S4W0Y8_9VIRU|nr:hypothetical protein psal_cds_242 [Pandoravirus salinus]AGO83790.2 hypothetical protein psal_cds_242 [Pandoravirus salinus]